MSYYRPQAQPGYVCLKGYYKLTPIDTIVYMEGDGGYTKCYFSDGRMVRLSCKISFANRQLPSFIRIHNSYLVNPAYILNWRHTDKYWSKILLLKTGVSLPISINRFRLMKQGKQLVNHPAHP